MTYGSPEWQKWVLGKEEGIAHIKAAYVVSPSRDASLIWFRYDAGINAFDTANASLPFPHLDQADR